MIMLDSFSFFFILPTKLFIMSYFKTFPFLETTNGGAWFLIQINTFLAQNPRPRIFVLIFNFQKNFLILLLFCLQNRFSVNLKNACRRVRWTPAHTSQFVLFSTFSIKIKFVKKSRNSRNRYFFKIQRKNSWKHSFDNGWM